ncbi:MAG: NotI family restriction endonuclease [Planctomycetaceae bacterium]
MSRTDTNKILELFGNSTRRKHGWRQVVDQQSCPFANVKCFKVRKSEPDVSIGTCSVRFGRGNRDIIICPNRLLERRQVFTDCLQLLTQHDPGNELHVLSEVSIPGGSVDYFVASVDRGKVKDFVAIEFQTMDTTGTIWPERQRLLKELKIPIRRGEGDSRKSFGINWKMTAKTILIQLHHKVATLEHVGKHLVLVIQDHLLEYLNREFEFGHLKEVRVGDPFHIHSYRLEEAGGKFKIRLDRRLSSDAAGVAKCLGIQAKTKIELEVIVAALEKKLSDKTLLTMDSPLALAEEMPAE